MTFTLYWRKRTGGFAPAAILAEAGQGWTGVYVESEKGENRQAAYLALNPLGRIPTLILPDGTVMTETAAMVIHLAELFPGAALLPPVGDPARPVALRWLLFGAVNIYEADLRYTYPARYSDDPADAPAVAQAARALTDQLWNAVAAAYGEGPYLLGRRYSVVDPYMAMLAAWHYEPRALLERLPVLRRLVDDVSSRPAIAPLWQDFDLGAKL